MLKSFKDNNKKTKYNPHGKKKGARHLLDHACKLWPKFSYVSPELIEENYCPPEADLWALGCIIYQLYYR